MLTLHPEALLRWNNPVGGVSDGVIVMWRNGSRPAILAQVFQIRDGTWLHECQSVAQHGFSMRRRDGSIIWEPKTAGVKFTNVADASEPASTKVARLTQMRALARQFSASDDFRIDARDADTTRHELRLMPKPLYRYDDPATGVLDAAVFAFAHGTDPEVFLLLEARSDKGEMTWHYALAPMTCWSVRVSHRGMEVWKAPERLRTHTIRTPYHVWAFDKAARR
jgi:hypothetical protein